MPVNTDVPGSRLIYDGDLAVFINIFIIFGLLAVLVTLWVVYKQDSMQTKYLLLVAWGILPPVWFLVEYFFLFLPHGVAGSFGFFQYGQSIASKLWAAVFALISVDIYRSKDK